MPDWWFMTFSCRRIDYDTTKYLIVQNCIRYKSVYYLSFPSWGLISLTHWPFLSDVIVWQSLPAQLDVCSRYWDVYLHYLILCKWSFFTRVFVFVGFFSFQFFQFLIILSCSLVPTRPTEDKKSPIMLKYQQEVKICLKLPLQQGKPIEMKLLKFRTQNFPVQSRILVSEN